MGRLFILGGIALLVLVAMILVAPRLLPGDFIKDQIIRDVERATGAEITLGEAQLQWRWGWRVTLRDGAMRGSGAALAVATGSDNDLVSYAVDIEEFRVEPALLPLLWKKLVVKSVQLTGQRLVIRWQNGEVAAAGFAVRITDLNLGSAGSADEGAVRSKAGKRSPGDRIPADLSFAFPVVADSLILQEISCTGLDMRGGFAERTLEVPVLSARQSSGTLKGTFVVDYVRDTWGHMEFQVEAEQVPAAALLAPWAPEIGNRLECELDATVGGGLDLRDDRTIRRTLDVSGLLTAGEGVLHASDWLQDVSKYLGRRQDLKDVRFCSLRHEFRLVKSRYLVEELAIVGGDTDWRGAGWLDLDGAIAMDIDVKLPPGFTPDLGNWSFLTRNLRDHEGRIILPLKLTGRTVRPTIGVNLGRLQRR